MVGSLTIVGLGPGEAHWLTPAAQAALDAASDLVGYGPYLDRIPARAGQTKHGSDNRVEIARAEHALRLAAEGRTVAVVSGGDPGVFAMAAAVFEALEAGDPAWRALTITVEPGITAMLAAAAKVGAPLGGDFCAISLSDNLKPWEVVTMRLEAALAADFVIALYNPISKARPWQLGAALELAAQHRPAETPVIFARAVGRPDENLRVLPLSQAVAAAASADMATLVMIGASSTRLIERPGQAAIVYTPRSVTKSPCATSQGRT
ncbi:precorrin-3B C(17)-methyltransferase [Bosea vaviloviae]|uniref:Precorrin-3B C(17)-methyltransferase n=1 Tax=Bosea vaviloviae TaxID=1526658 RepID=A0A1D7UAC8_9HYPH|nr:precorrin-3B C(17)-methyltransferase [Bosea vaviloviae]AOO84320.1 precorrin-3B C(17)-methyltransferase [Bosea vaviloviae]